MKLSVSLPEEDVEFLDAYAAAQGVESRSAVLHRAVRLLRAAELTTAYEQAWDEWATTDDASLWDLTASDGVADAAR
jgi:Arc/MetJ-type ribon-helix-helix transcriptional regulator